MALQAIVVSGIMPPATHLCTHPETGTRGALNNPVVCWHERATHGLNNVKDPCIYMPLAIASLACSRVLPNHGKATDDKHTTQYNTKPF